MKLLLKSGKRGMNLLPAKTDIADGLVHHSQVNVYPLLCSRAPI